MKIRISAAILLAWSFAALQVSAQTREQCLADCNSEDQACNNAADQTWSDCMAGADTAYYSCMSQADSAHSACLQACGGDPYCESFCDNDYQSATTQCGNDHSADQAACTNSWSSDQQACRAAYDACVFSCPAQYT